MAKVSLYRIPLTNGLVVGSTKEVAYQGGDVQGDFSTDANINLLFVNGGQLVLVDDTDTFSITFGVSGFTLTWLHPTKSIGDVDDVFVALNLGARTEIVGFPVTVGQGGTGATTQAGARANLGLGTIATYAASAFLAAANNLSDLASASVARANLGLGTIATYAASAFLSAANNLSDLANAATARTNLGLGSIATYAASAFLSAANNLSDLANAATARANLGVAIGTDVQAYDVDTAKTDTAQNWTKMQRAGYTALAITTNAITINCNTDSNKLYVDLTANIASITLSNPADGVQVKILFVQGASYTITGWPAAVVWQTSDGAAPTIGTSADKSMTVTLDYNATEAKWYGQAAVQG